MAFFTSLLIWYLIYLFIERFFWMGAGRRWVVGGGGGGRSAAGDGGRWTVRTVGGGRRMAGGWRSAAGGGRSEFLLRPFLANLRGKGSSCGSEPSGLAKLQDFKNSIIP